MSTGTRENSLGFGNLILRFRKPIGLTLIAITIFMAYWAVHVPIATRFEDLFPAQHPNTLLYREFRPQYAGAQTLVLLLRVEQGDIFNPKTLLDIQQITREVDALSGVNHNEIFSLASYRVVYARAEPGALLSAPYMYPDVPKTQDQINDLKTIVLAHREQLAGYYTRDGKGALVIASFNERRLDVLGMGISLPTPYHDHFCTVDRADAGHPLPQSRAAQRLVGANCDRYLLRDLGSRVRQPDGL